MSKIQLLIIILIFSAGVIFGRWIWPQNYSYLSSTPQPIASGEITPQAAFTATSSSTIAGIHEDKTWVKRVIDGDTIELTDGRKVRYVGMDAPETVDPYQPKACFGQEATEKNQQLVLNKNVILEKDVSETDRFGRLLRYVYIDTTQGRIMVNELLIKEGFATSMTYPPDVKYQSQFQLAQQQARNAQLGLWYACINTTASPSLSGVSQVNSFTSQIDGCLIKGNISTSGKIYHLPGCGSYDKTVIDETSGERWFCNETEAVEAGWRKAKNCP